MIVHPDKQMVADNRRTYTFHLITNKFINEELADKVYSICDDCIIGGRFNTSIITFNRKAHLFAEAADSAINALESIPGIKIVRMEPSNIVTVSDICERLKINPTEFYKLSSTKQPFPTPFDNVMSKNVLWEWTEVASWAYMNKFVDIDVVIQATYIGKGFKERVQ
jgi:hypothetical protein